MTVERIEVLKEQIAELEEETNLLKTILCGLVLKEQLAEYYPDVELERTVMKVGKQQCVLASYQDMYNKNVAEKAFTYPSVYVRPLKKDGTPSNRLVFGGNYLKRYEG